MSIAPVASEKSSESASRDRRFNFAACLTDAVGWPLGMAFFSLTTVVPALMAYLGASNRAVGSLVGIINLLIFLPGFLMVGYIGKLAQARSYLLGVALAERFALAPLIPLTILWGRSHPGWLLAALFIAFIGNSLFMGLNQPAYWIVVGKCVPLSWRGRLFGVAGCISGVLGIAVDRCLQRLLSGPSGGFPKGFGESFAIGFVIMTVSVLPLGFVREANSVPRSKDDPHVGHYWRDSRTVLRNDRPFLYFLLSQIPSNLIGLAVPFFVLYARRELGAAPGAIAIYTATMIFASSFGSVVWGGWGDLKGYKGGIIAGNICALLAVVLSLVIRIPELFFLVFMFSALASASSGLAGNNIVLEYSPKDEDIPLYTSIYNLATALPRSIAPLAGGILADLGGYHTVFAISALIACISLFLSLAIVDPRSNKIRTPSVA